jgi:hypothetical protein
VRDGINLARRGVPAVALVTEEFLPQSVFVARAAGMPDIPRIILPHPIAGTGREAMRKVAESYVPAMLSALGRPS